MTRVSEINSNKSLYESYKYSINLLSESFFYAIFHLTVANFATS